MSQNRSNSSMLVLFARYPERGEGKRRIAKDLGDPATYQVAKHLYVAGWFDLLRWAGPKAIATTSARPLREKSPFPTHRLSEYVLQSDGNLGERIKAAERKLRDSHKGPLIFIGSDSPELQDEQIREADTRLCEYDVVICPARDGGVTLMAVREQWPQLDDLPWSSDKLCSALVKRCKRQGLSVFQLQPGHDTDDCYDLLRLRNSLAEDMRPDRRSLHQLISKLFPTVGVVVPVKGDHKTLARLLTRLQRVKPDKIVVVDADYDQLTARRCHRYGASYMQGGSNRGERMDIGARFLETDIVWFLHADANPQDSSADEIRMHSIRGHCGGWFRFAFDGEPAPLKQLLEKCINWRARHGIPYGDQGLFVRRKVYKKTGGVRHYPLFEEAELVRELRKQKLPFKELSASIGVSERRWQKDGWLRRTLKNRWLALQYMFGVSPETLAEKYRKG